MSRLPHLPVAASLTDTVANFDTIIAWATEENSPIGYFATVYKRATLAIERATMRPGRFRKPTRMEEFAKAFSQRYFDALNSYFAPPRRGQHPTAVWGVHVDGTKLKRPVILQHLLTAVNAHINLDLGIAACQVGGANLPALRNDFNHVNAILGSQIQGVLDALSDVSPGLAEIRRLFLGEVDEVEEIRKLLITFRDAAWNYAVILSKNPDLFDELVAGQDASTTELGRCYLKPPLPMSWILARVKDVEETDVATIITALDVDVTLVSPLNTRFLN